MNFSKFTFSYLREIDYGLAEIEQDLGPAMERALEMIQAAPRIYLIGNGGSAALASHMATDLQLAGKWAIALTDVAALSTYANDFGYVESFAGQVSILGKPGDLLIAISGSGNSPNILSAVDIAAAMKLQVIALVGMDGGSLANSYGTHTLHIPCPHMGVSQDMHQIILHIFTYYLMEQLKGRK